MKDVRIEGFDYARRWNLDKDGKLWIVTPGSEEEVGCIHTCQGLEQVVTDAARRSKQDQSIRGYNKWLRSDPPAARTAADRVIKNTYRTLMTRGQKGCFVFSVDPETNAWLKSRAVGRTDAGGRLLMAAEEPPPYGR